MGIRHRHRRGAGSQGAERGHHSPDLGQEERAGVHARLAAEGVPPLGARWKRRTASPSGRTSTIRRSTTRTSSTTRRRSRSRSSRAWTRSIPRSCAPTRSWASRSTSRRCWPAWPSTRSSTASPWPPPSRASWPRWASSSARSPRRCRSIPSWCKKYLGTVVPYTRQLLRRAERGGLHRRLVCLHPQGRALPDGAVHLLPHQRRRDRPVRAHADRRRRRRVRQLSRRLHRSDPRREPAARRRGRAGRAGQRADQVLDRAELVSRRQGRQGRHLQLRHQARQLPGRELEDLVDAGRDRLGDHLEVSRAAFCRATTRWASSTRWR